MNVEIPAIHGNSVTFLEKKSAWHNHGNCIKTSGFQVGWSKTRTGRSPQPHFLCKVCKDELESPFSTEGFAVVEAALERNLDQPKMSELINNIPILYFPRELTIDHDFRPRQVAQGIIKCITYYYSASNLDLKLSETWSVSFFCLPSTFFTSYDGHTAETSQSQHNKLVFSKITNATFLSNDKNESYKWTAERQYQRDLEIYANLVSFFWKCCSQNGKILADNNAAEER